MYTSIPYCHRTPRCKREEQEDQGGWRERIPQDPAAQCPKRPQRLHRDGENGPGSLRMVRRTHVKTQVKGEDNRETQRKAEKLESFSASLCASYQIRGTMRSAEQLTLTNAGQHSHVALVATGSQQFLTFFLLNQLQEPINCWMKKKKQKQPYGVMCPLCTLLPREGPTHCFHMNGPPHRDQPFSSSKLRKNISPYMVQHMMLNRPLLQGTTLCFKDLKNMRELIMHKTGSFSNYLTWVVFHQTQGQGGWMPCVRGQGSPVT